MPIAIASSDDDRGATLFARIPEALNEEKRQAKYDNPLSQKLTQQGIVHSLRGFFLPATDSGGPAGVGIEVQVDDSEMVALVAQEIADLGAPLETVLEIETEKHASSYPWRRRSEDNQIVPGPTFLGPLRCPPQNVIPHPAKPRHVLRRSPRGRRQGPEPSFFRGRGVCGMKIASVADIKARLSAYLKQSQEGPVIVTRNGKAVAVLLAVTDDDELERLVLAHSPKFQALLNESRRQIEKTGGIPHAQFWHEVQVESHETAGKANRGPEVVGKAGLPGPRRRHRVSAARRAGGM